MDRQVPHDDDGSDGAAPDGGGSDDFGSGLEAFDFLYGDQSTESTDVPSFTITNPPRTVAVTAHLDGRIERVTLFAGATGLTETELAEEVVVVAELATQDARSAQYASALDGMRELGHDEVSTRDFLTRNLDLPSPQDALAARAQVFATRYQGEND
jgi:hypothetical protein